MSTVAQPEQAKSAPSSSTDNAGEKTIRITSHGKMKPWIANSLTFFETTEENRTLVFHTLPPSIDAKAGLLQESGKQVTPKAGSSATDLISRLISVTEIIKREYIKQLDATHSTRMIGLHQYNEIGTLEALGATVAPPTEGGQVEDSPEVQRSRSILQALSGKNHPRQTQTPFMRITLSLQELPQLIQSGATYQPPLKRKLSKSAKMRAKKRGQKLKAAIQNDVEMNDEAMPPTPLLPQDSESP